MRNTFPERYEVIPDLLVETKPFHAAGKKIAPPHPRRCMVPHFLRGGKLETHSAAMRPNGGLPFCDHHGWRWEPGQGPSPCIGETTSFLLALCVLFFSVSVIRGADRRGHRAAFPNRSCADHVHAAQMVLSIALAIAAVAGGVLIARSRGMLCVALALHSVFWSFSWAISACTMQRSPRSCRRLLWFWCCALVSNRLVLPFSRG